MAALTFAYRSKKPKAFLEARLSFRIEGKNLCKKEFLDNGKPNQIYGKEMPYSFYKSSRIEVSKKFWNEYKKKTNFKDATKVNLRDELDIKISNLRKSVLDCFEQSDIEKINKGWLDKAINNYYNPPKPKEIAPSDLVEYYNYYLKLKEHTLKASIRSWQKWITVRNKLKRMIEAENRSYGVKNVDESFVRDWIKYCKKEGYAFATIKKEFSYIKTICTHAKRKSLEVSPELDGLRVELKPPKLAKVYLSLKELEAVSSLDGLPQHLDNVRDWLLISCYTGQRISDFMRFNKSMLREAKGKTFLDIKQVKTNKEVSIPIMPMVLEILNKRDGEFPNPFSAQKYNLYVKEVVRLAGIEKEIRGGLRINNRMKVDTYPKWQLIGSHVGRRSLATNFYGKMPTSYLKNITGHSTERMLLSYIGKDSKDTASDAYDLMFETLK